MHNLRNNTHVQEALQSHKTKTQLVAVGGCGQVRHMEIDSTLIVHFCQEVSGTRNPLAPKSLCFCALYCLNY